MLSSVPDGDGNALIVSDCFSLEQVLFLIWYQLFKEVLYEIFVHGLLCHSFACASFVVFRRLQ